MSEFHRMITYLYLYEHGTKGHNVGFAKIEKRSGQCLVEIHMKNTGHNASSAPVYFYAENQGRHPGILLGTMGLSRGGGDFKTRLEGEPFLESEYSLADIRGIFIPLSEEIMFVSQWDDSEFSRDNFIEWTPAPAGGSAQTQPENSSPDHSSGNSSVRRPGSHAFAAQNAAHTVSSSQEVSEPQTIKYSSAIPDAAQSSDVLDNTAHSFNAPDDTAHSFNAQNDTAHSFNAPDDTAHSSGFQQTAPLPAAQNAAEAPVQTRSAASVLPDLSAAEAVPNFRENLPGKNGLPLPTIPKPEPLPENWNLKWEFIMENYPVMTPFAGDEKTICVRWELKDLRLLPRQYWYLGNNSFLLHGFFNYRYLILGITEKAEKKRWFIGIPGVYQNPERVMATLFGFPEFRNEKSVPVNTGEFGYWYRYLNE